MEYGHFKGIQRHIELYYFVTMNYYPDAHSCHFNVTRHYDIL